MDREIDKAAQSLSGLSEKIAALLNEYLFDFSPQFNASRAKNILLKLDVQIYSPAFAILSDQSKCAKLVEMESIRDTYFPQAPINRLCELFVTLKTAPSGGVVEMLSPFMQSNEDVIRRDVAFVVASIGSKRSLPAIRAALEDRQEYVYEFALRGIERAISKDRIHRATKSSYFDLLADLWQRRSPFLDRSQIPLMLLQLDRDRGSEFLQDERFLHLRFAGLPHILAACEQECVMLPAEYLRTAIQKIESLWSSDTAVEFVSYALPLLAAHREDRDLPLLEYYFASLNDAIVSAAIKSLYRYYEYYDHTRNPWEVIDATGWDSLTEAEKYLCAIEELDDIVRDAGFAEYFASPSADHWRDALQGLNAIGAVEYACEMCGALNCFQGGKPSTDLVERQSQLAQIERQANQETAPFLRHNVRWGTSISENLQRLLYKYNITHLEGREQNE